MTRRGLIKSLATCGATVSLRVAGSDLPTQCPQYGPLNPLTIPSITERMLDNGMTVWVAPNHSLPKVSFVLAVHGGSAADDPRFGGSSELLARVIGMGTKMKTAEQVADAAQGCGGDLLARTSFDANFLEMSVLSSRCDAALSLLADVSRNARLSGGSLATAKNKLLTELKIEQNQPASLARRIIYSNLFRDHPYGRLRPEPAEVEQLTSEVLLKDYLSRYRPDSSLLVVCGQFETSDLMRSIARYFSDWRAPALPKVAAVVAPARYLEASTVCVSRPNGVQASLFFGTRGPNRGTADYPAFVVANDLFGGGVSSRLMSNIRESKGYAYSPGSYIATDRASAVFIANADVRTNVAAPTLNEITYELNRLATTAPPEAEVERAKRHLAGSLALRLQVRSGLASALADLWLLNLKPDYLASETTEIEHVTPDLVLSISQKYLAARYMQMVGIGDEKQVQQSLSLFRPDVKIQNS